ncbi:hypothetical protein [Chryseobacterium sediminis]|uniref:hypothetical protein n=1 Tax=Chryseobacterium sediminis TaxID=1679494 RepID=UPI00285E78E0|nr:hypothetical protein [Chryseobacterium sediminis]MDR6464968.1 hypothetical protein [Chryseobacterium sediminis]
MNKNTNAYFMKKWSLFFLLTGIIINFSACKKENPRLQVNYPKKQESSYQQEKIKKIKIKEDENSIIYELQSSNLNKLYLKLDLNKEIAELEIKNNRIETNFNFTYDITIEDAINRIKVLSDTNGNLIFLIPTATEEYLSFQILKYESKSNMFFSSNFYFETHKDVLGVFLNSSISLHEKDNKYTLNVASYKFTGYFQPEIKINANANWNKNLIDFKGFYNICTANERKDSIKSETCYEITIKSDLASIDANTSLCKGNYKIEQIQNNEINLINENDNNCHFKIKKEERNYFIKLNNSNDWIIIEKEN